MGRTMTAPATAVKTATVDSASDQTFPRGFEVHFLPAESRVRQMRRVTSAHLRLWDLTALRDTAILVVSELVTNAVRHGQGKPVGLRVTNSAHELRVEVTDGSPTPARLREAGEVAESGRGLLLVSAVSKEWGVSPDGTMTWCSLAIPEGGERDGRGWQSMRRDPSPHVGPALRSGSPRQQARPTARRREFPAPHVPLGELWRPGAGHLLLRTGSALLAALRHPISRRQPAPAMQQLVADEEQRFSLLCQQITPTRQGARK